MYFIKFSSCVKNIMLESFTQTEQLNIANCGYGDYIAVTVTRSVRASHLVRHLRPSFQVAPVTYDLLTLGTFLDGCVQTVRLVAVSNLCLYFIIARLMNKNRTTIRVSLELNTTCTTISIHVKGALSCLQYIVHVQMYNHVHVIRNY